ncbi:hypothetical protein PG994_003525 [Apiospora phragmitis]|uniref:Uncharacterized protein n=1 Tax=Apiospora phragmitis TaxID=2905665 RepID=A0ABR1VYG0_9PEZI
MMKLPEELREEMAVRIGATKNDITTSMVAFTKQMNETLDDTKKEVKDRVDGYNPRLNRLEKKTNNIDATVRELDKKVDKKIKAAQNEAQKDRGVDIKAEVKEEVNECLRGFGAYLTEYFANDSAPARGGGAGVSVSAGVSVMASASANANVRGLVPRRPFGLAPTAAAVGPAALPMAALPVAAGGGHAAAASADPTTGPALAASRAPAAGPVAAAAGRASAVPDVDEQGYHTLMKTIKFNDVNHLVQLAKLDNFSIARRCTMFTDMKFNLYTIDYVVHSGLGTNLLRHVDLSQLRLLRMKIDPRVMLHDDQVRYTAWERQWKPPAYVYDLGELFLRKKSARTPYHIASHLTAYNLLLEVSCSSRRVWIVMSPQHELTRKREGAVRDSNCAFNGLEFARLAVVAHDVAELQFDRPDFLPSAAGFEAAHRLVLESLCPGLPLVDFNKNISLKLMCADLA